MVFQLIWTEKALADLKDICVHIAKDNTNAARKVGLDILERAELLKNFPDMGPRYPRNGGKYREILCYSYRIFYKVEPETNTVIIMRVWHGSQDESDLVL